MEKKARTTSLKWKIGKNERRQERKNLLSDNFSNLVAIIKKFL